MQLKINTKYTLRRLLSYMISIAILIIIIYCIWKHYQKPIDPIIIELKQQLRKIHPMIDQIEMYEGKRSYTINKEKVYLCLKDEKGEYYDKNMLTYVLLHELAHVLCDEVGHTDKFHEIFNGLLDRAVDLKLYDPDIPIIKNYCTY